MNIYKQHKNEVLLNTNRIFYKTRDIKTSQCKNTYNKSREIIS